MKVCFEEIGHMSATFAAESGEGGDVVKVSANGTVAPCADGDVFCGVMEGIRKGFVTYVINTKDVAADNKESDGHQIRQCAVENNVTMFTALDTVRVLLDVLEETTLCISTIDA